MSRGGSAECQPLMDAALCGIAVGCTQLASCGIFVISTSLPIRSLALPLGPPALSHSTNGGESSA